MSTNSLDECELLTPESELEKTAMPKAMRPSKTYESLWPNKVRPPRPHEPGGWKKDQSDLNLALWIMASPFIIAGVILFLFWVVTPRPY